MKCFNTPKAGLLQDTTHKSRNMPLTQYSKGFPHLFLHSSKQVDIYFTGTKTDRDKGWLDCSVLLVFCRSSRSCLFPRCFVLSRGKENPECFTCMMQPFPPTVLFKGRETCMNYFCQVFLCPLLLLLFTMDWSLALSPSASLERLWILCFAKKNKMFMLSSLQHGPDWTSCKIPKLCTKLIIYPYLY